MKKIAAILFFIAGLAVAAVAQGDTTYQSARFAITYPGKWQLIKNYSPMVAMVALAPRTSGADDFSENVNVVIDTTTDLTGITPEHYRDLSLEGIKHGLVNVKIDSAGMDTLKTGAAAGTLIYSHVAGNIKIKVLTYFCITETMGYVITCSAKQEEFDAYYPAFVKSCRSFKAKP